MKNLIVAFALVATAVVGYATYAGEHRHCRCHHCGRAADCCKVCRLVCETKEVPEVVYECKCEDFCVPGPSSRCKECVTDCEGCTHKVYQWTPGGAKIHTRKVLVKKEIKVKKTTYKWVVEDLCKNCEGTAPIVNVPADDAIPLPPSVESKLLYGPEKANEE